MRNRRPAVIERGPIQRCGARIADELVAWGGSGCCSMGPDRPRTVNSVRGRPDDYLASNQSRSSSSAIVAETFLAGTAAEK
jgi:hypothetical protein